MPSAFNIITKLHWVAQLCFVRQANIPHVRLGSDYGPPISIPEQFGRTLCAITSSPKQAKDQTLAPMSFN